MAMESSSSSAEEALEASSKVPLEANLEATAKTTRLPSNELWSKLAMHHLVALQ